MANTGDTSTPERTTLYVNLKGLRAAVQAAADEEGRTLTNMTARLLVLGLAARTTTPANDESRRSPAGSR